MGIGGVGLVRREGEMEEVEGRGRVVVVALLGGQVSFKSTLLYKNTEYIKCIELAIKNCHFLQCNHCLFLLLHIPISAYLKLSSSPSLPTKPTPPMPFPQRFNPVNYN